MNLWAPVDRIGDWIREQLGIEAQMRLGVLMVFLGLAFFPAKPIFFRDEGWGVFIMSALALLFAGFAFIVGVEALDALEDDVEDVADHVDGCPTCGQPRPA